MVSADELKELKKAVSEALNTAERLERCHETYRRSMQESGFSRARTTSYNANASNLASVFKAEVESIKVLSKKLFYFE